MNECSERKLQLIRRKESCRACTGTIQGAGAGASNPELKTGRWLMGKLGTGFKSSEEHHNIRLSTSAITSIQTGAHASRRLLFWDKTNPSMRRLSCHSDHQFHDLEFIKPPSPGITKTTASKIPTCPCPHPAILNRQPASQRPTNSM